MYRMLHSKFQINGNVQIYGIVLQNNGKIHN